MLLLELLPLLAFFISYQLYDIYIAVGTLMVVSVIALLLSYFTKRTVSRSQWLMLGVALVFGGLTLAFQDKRFIMYKPSIVQWLIAIAIIVSHILKKPLLKLVFGKILDLPHRLWWKVSVFWSVYFVVSGIVNIYVANTMSEAAWINFKVFGNTAANIVLIIGTIIACRNYLIADEQSDN